MAQLIAKRLELLRSLMRDNNVDTFLLTKFDPHQSEYSSDRWNYIKYFSGFTGSAGTIVVTKDMAAFWTDGRYSLQSEKELSGTEYVIYNTSDSDCITLESFIYKNTQQEGIISFDERTLNQKRAEELLSEIKDKNISFVSGLEIIKNAITQNFPKTTSAVFSHDIKYCGVSRNKKLRLVRDKMHEKKSEAYIISSLEDIAWLFNCRFAESPTLSFPAYAIITANKAILFTDENLTEIQNELTKDNVEILGYNSVYEYLSESSDIKTVLLAPYKTCYALYERIRHEDIKIIHLTTDITTDLKAVKNQTEIENFRHTCIIDGVSLVKFIRWIKNAVKTDNITEYEAGLKLDEIRKREETFITPSFSTICGYGANGAIIHYRANEDSALIKPEGLLLIDSGGNYLGGTTDITRTIVLGSLTDEMKDNFTLVLKCHIALAKAIFLEKTTGYYLDILARKPLWDKMLNFKHGTGHGIGFALSVHEGPHRIAFQYNSVPIVAGMLISNEPGFYKDGEYGIRSENIVLVKEHGESSYGKFYDFETVSLGPFDTAAINKDLLTEEEIDWLNNYNQEVYSKLSPYLDDEERLWLKNETKAI